METHGTSGSLHNGDIIVQTHKAKTISLKRHPFLIDPMSQSKRTAGYCVAEKIMTKDIDQLLSTGEWKAGVVAAVEGVQKVLPAILAAAREGWKNKTVEWNRNAIADCRYEIKNPGGTVRKCGALFIVVAENNTWKISAIRNMKPTEER